MTLLLLAAVQQPVNVNVDTGGPWEGIAGAALQAGVLIIGGLWALVLYWRHREGRPRLIISVRWRFVSTAPEEILLVSLHIVNSSSVLYRNIQARAYLLDASRHDSEGRIVFRVVSVNPDVLRETVGVIRIQGDRVGFRKANVMGLEPDECLDTEVAFVLHSLPPLLAMQVEVDHPMGWFRTLWRHVRHPRTYSVRHWKIREGASPFFFIDPSQGSGHTEDVVLGSTGHTRSRDD